MGDITPEQWQQAQLTDVLDQAADDFDLHEVPALARWLYDCGVRAPGPVAPRCPFRHEVESYPGLVALCSEPEGHWPATQHRAEDGQTLP